MALLKKGQYGNDWQVDLGDPKVEAEMGDQLKVTDSELLAAINAENLSDRIFARLLTNRSKAHQRLLDLVPGAKG